MRKAADSCWTARDADPRCTNSRRAPGGDKFSFTVGLPFEFESPRHPPVAAQWKGGIGCPLNAYTAPFLPPDFSTVGSDR